MRAMDLSTQTRSLRLRNELTRARSSKQASERAKLYIRARAKANPCLASDAIEVGDHGKLSKRASEQANEQ